MKIRKLKRGNIKSKSSKPSPRIQSLLNQAFTCVNNGNLSQAEGICKEIIKLSPNTSECFNILGIIYQERGLLDEAITILYKAIKLESSNTNALFNLGTVLGQKGEHEKAVTVLRKGLALAPRSPKAWNNLGLALIVLGKLNEAISSFEKATKLDSHYGSAWLCLGDIYHSQGQLKKAVDTYKKCIQSNPDFVDAHYNLSTALNDLKLLPEAIKSLQQTIELAPAHAAARHMLAALSGETPDSAPPQFVTTLFDQYSSNFETDLIDRLEYKIPTLMRELFSQYIPNGTCLPKVIDLGCGTGLSGQAFKDISDYLAGIDISRNMLKQAKEKKIYDDLFLGDLCEELLKLTDSFDLFIAADVMIYIGNLETIFKTVNNKSSPRSYFIFSVESNQQNGFTLQPSGRYGHSSAYISKLASMNDFIVIEEEQTKIRKEDDTWISGYIYLLQKNSD